MSIPEWKKKSIQKYKNKLIEVQKQYAYNCNAEYQLFNPKSIINYVDLQFAKILKVEDLTKYYDQVVYFDLDIIPITKINIFEHFNFNKICVYDYDVDLEDEDVKRVMKIHLKHFPIIPSMDRTSKMMAKKAMLMHHDIMGNNKICNTGVICANKSAIENLAFSDNLTMMDNTMQQAKDDSLFPDEFSKGWIRNNEIYFSFLLEKYKVDYINIGLQWNYILDHAIKKWTSGAHIIHQVNKDFELTFNSLLN